MPLFEVNELGLKAWLSNLLCHSFKNMISYFISFPLMRGEGWDGGGHRGSTHQLNPPPPWGEEVIFLTQLGLKLKTGSPVRLREAPPLKAWKRARLRVNLEQAPAFRLGSRKVHSF